MPSETVGRDLTRLGRIGAGGDANHLSLRRRTSADTTGEVSRVLGKLEATGQNYTILQLLANASALFRPFILFSDALNNRSQIPPDVRETVILTVAAHAEAQYEWAEHAPMARAAGLTDCQIAALADPSQPAAQLFSSEQLLALAVTAELRRGTGVTAATWQLIVGQWGEPGAIELIAIIGWWGGLVQTMLAALGLGYPDDDRPGRRSPS
jgi:alkylhydroperoxidase family enzyme